MLDQREPQTSTPRRHAGVWVRVAAGLIDLLAMGAPVLGIAFVVLGVDDVLESDVLGIPNVAITVVLAVITILLWVNWDGRTPGKKLMRIRIVNFPDYQPFAYGTATTRTVVGLLSAAPLMLGYVVIAFMVAWRTDKRGYHDLIARTCVVHDD